jgi:hypothetical protein
MLSNSSQATMGQDWQIMQFVLFGYPRRLGTIDNVFVQRGPNMATGPPYDLLYNFPAVYTGDVAWCVLCKHSVVFKLLGQKGPL